jgi:hypothetical protein
MKTRVKTFLGVLLMIAHANLIHLQYCNNDNPDFVIEDPMLSYATVAIITKGPISWKFSFDHD